MVDFLAVSRCMMTCACFEESVIACNVICLDVRSKQNAIELKSNPTQANMNWRMQGQSKNHVSHVKLNHSLPGRRCCMTSNQKDCPRCGQGLHRRTTGYHSGEIVRAPARAPELLLPEVRDAAHCSDDMFRNFNPLAHTLVGTESKRPVKSSFRRELG